MSYVPKGNFKGCVELTPQSELLLETSRQVRGESRNSIHSKSGTPILFTNWKKGGQGLVNVKAKDKSTKTQKYIQKT